MKDYFILLVLIVFNINIIKSQSNLGPSSGFFGNNDTGNLVNWETNDHHLLTFYNKSKVFGVGTKDSKVEGSLFLFDTWKNDGIIQIGKRKFKLSNINFHIEKDAFMSKIQGDSMLVFESSYLDKIMVNNRSFKYIYNASESKSKIYEVIYETKDVTILKGYYLSVKLSSPNPMLNRPTDKIRKNSNYFLLENGNLTKFKLQKKNILGLVKKEDVEKLETYVKKYRLSYKDEDDINKMLSYIIKT